MTVRVASPLIDNGPGALFTAARINEGQSIETRANKEIADRVDNRIFDNPLCISDDGVCRGRFTSLAPDQPPHRQEPNRTIVIACQTIVVMSNQLNAPAGTVDRNTNAPHRHHPSGWKSAITTNTGRTLKAGARVLSTSDRESSLTSPVSSLKQPTYHN
ncbi:MAG TPA: hypothetical protein VEZ90_07200 [Blastocatellia bacterium]|nr:hypothetical protein [Blastocatellia bacterium]